MSREIKIFHSFEEQEKYFLGYFFSLSASERLKELSLIQKKNFKNFLEPQVKKITIQKTFPNGY